MKSVSRAELDRVTRIYKTNKEASEALGLHPGSFARLCRQHGILTPYMRRQLQRTTGSAS